MNLKKKLSIIVLLCFTLNMLLLFGYYELVLYDKIEESLNTMQIELRNDVNYISSQIKRLQGTDNIKDWINNIDNIDKKIKEEENEKIIARKTKESIKAQSDTLRAAEFSMKLKKFANKQTKKRGIL